MVVALEVAGHIGNADVLEVIAEYACGTVKDALALRASNTGYRRAVDTTVRRLVCEDQPLTAPAGVRATLSLHRDTAHLDAVRIAFTCDAFPRIARLVVVAFALDGAKDELREGGVCGPRPVEWGDEPFIDAIATDRPQVASCWGDARCDSASPVSRALRRCLATICVTHETLTEALCEAAESNGFPFVENCGWLVSQGCDPDPRRTLRFFTVVGPQLTCLCLHRFDPWMAPAVASCCKLRRFYGRQLREETDAPVLVDALIASGAPLTHVSFDCSIATETTRLLDAMPTIIKLKNLVLSDLPSAVVDRLHEFNSTALPRAQRRRANHPTHFSPASEFVTTLLVESSAAPLPFAGVATAFPNLRRLRVKHVAADVVVADMRLPPSLTELGTTSALAFGDAGIFRQLARQGPAHFTHLTSISLLCEGTDQFVELTPLVSFAGTLRRLDVRWWGKCKRHSSGDDDAKDATSAMAALSELVALESVTIPTLGTAKCFLGGSHTRLRTLLVGHRDGVTITQLAKACPRLVSVSTRSRSGAGEPLPPGWVFVKGDGLEIPTMFNRVSLS